MHPDLRPRPFVLALIASALLLLPPVAAKAQSRGEEEALRQLEFAQGELDQANFQKALTSAESALRLFPPLYEAMAYKAYALEGLGELKLAESMLIAYREMRGNWEKLPAGEAALERVREKLTGSGGSSAPQFTGIASLADMPAYPQGSEEYLAWLVMKQQQDEFKTRMQVGGGVMAGGLVLAAVGGVLMGVTAALSVDNEEDPNIRAFYAGGVGAIFSGGTMFVVGLPLLASSGAQLAKLQKAARSTGSDADSSARLEAGPVGLTLRW